MGFLAAAAPLLGGMMGAGGAAAGGLATAATIGSTVLGAAGALMQGSAEASQHKYQAQVAQNNAQIAEQNYTSSLLAGNRAESQQKMKVTRLIAGQKADQAANGVDVAVGSAPMVRDSSQAEGDWDALAIRYNAAKQAYGYQVEKTNDLAQADMEKRAAKNAKLKSYIGAASSIIGGAGKLAGNSMAMGGGNQFAPDLKGLW